MNDIQTLRERVKDLKVLFVDDEKDVRDGTGTFLRKFFNDVSVRSDGLEGLEIFKDGAEFDVVLTDVMMPNMDGIAMAKEMKKIKPETFFILLTASKELQEVEGDMSNMTFLKPLSFEDMIVIMKNLGDTEW